MSPEFDDRRLIELFEQAIEQTADRRLDWARQACAGDARLCARLLGLLAADAEGNDRLGEVVGAGARDLYQRGSPVRGQRFGPWRIVAEIGVGGMGVVFEAERADAEYRKRVAIKLIRGLPDRDRLERLRSERQILADLDHPNIAALIDGGSSDDGQPYLVMEFIDGCPIDRWCAERNTPLRERVRMLIEATTAVHYAHQHLVIHRDIKPGNVLVTMDGTPKLLDFGIAKLIEAAEDGAEQTQARYFTPNYSSPEQREGRPISTASDIYSLGRLLETVLAAGPGDRPPPRELRAIITRAATERPEDRYPSASALAADLQRFLDGRAVEAMARRRGYRLWRFIARHRLAVGTAALALMLVASLIWRIGLESERARLAAADAGQTLAFLTGLIESARPESTQGRDLTVASVLERGDAQLDAAVGATPALRAGIATTLASAWHALDEFSRAQSLYARAADEAAAAGDLPGALRARAKTLVVATRAGRAQEMTETAQRLRSDFEHYAPEDAEIRADVLNDWAVWANESGQAEAARRALLEVVALRGRLGDQAKLAAAEHNLAIAEDRLGNVDAALMLVERSLERKRRALGAHHPSTLLGLRGVAVFAAKAAQFGRAAAVLDELLTERIRLFGADNPVLAADYNERASAAHDAGDYARAVELYQRALRLDAGLDDRPARYIYLNNLAAVHEDRGDYSTAEPLLLESLRRREAQFGADHPATLRARHNLARLWLLLGRVERARELAEANLTRYREVLGAEHRDSRYAELQLAWIARSGSSSAQPSPERIIATVEAVLRDTAANSLRGLGARSLLARTLRETGRYGEARVLLQAIIDDYRKQFGPAHPKAAELELEIARIDRAEGRAEAAAERIGRAAPILVGTLAPRAPARVLLDCLQARHAADQTTC